MATSANHPTNSKINVAALIVALVNLSVFLGYVPDTAREAVLMVANTVGPALIVILRTYFTVPKGQQAKPVATSFFTLLAALLLIAVVTAAVYFAPVNG